MGHPEWGQFRLGKTNPNTSTSGLHALYGTYFAAVGRPPVDADLTDPAAMKYVRDVEIAVVHYGDTVSGFLVNLLDADRRGVELKYVSAIAMEEKQVFDYNNGNPRSLLVPDEDPPNTQLFAFYPKEGTLFADHPYAILNAPWVDADERAAAEGFFGYLVSPAVQRQFTQAGFRDHGGVPGPEISGRYGLIPEQPRLVHTIPPAALLERMQRSWDDLRKRAHLVLLVDISAAMAAPVSSGGTKLDLAKIAAKAALEELAVDDDVGLWVFSAGLSSNTPYREISGLGPLASRREELRAAIDALQPTGGDTPLFATTRAGVRHVGDRFDRSRINALMLLTSGRNTDRDDDLLALQRELQTQNEEARVRIFAMSYGSAADFETVRKIARSSGGIGYNALDPTTTIGRVITQMLSNF
jgi:Ca-activated chloride channel family protein